MVPLAFGQQADDFCGEFVGQFMHPVHRAGGQRAGQNDDPRSGHSQRRGPGVRRPGEGAGYDADRGKAPGLGYYCVVETPRRAGTSICNAVNDGVTLLNQGFQRFIGAGGAEGKLAGVDDLLSVVLVFQDGLQLL